MAKFNNKITNNNNNFQEEDILVKLKHHNGMSSKNTKLTYHLYLKVDSLVALIHIIICNKNVKKTLQLRSMNN